MNFFFFFFGENVYSQNMKTNFNSPSAKMDSTDNNVNFSDHRLTFSLAKISDKKVFMVITGNSRFWKFWNFENLPMQPNA